VTLILTTKNKKAIGGVKPDSPDDILKKHAEKETQKMETLLLKENLKDIINMTSDLFADGVAMVLRFFYGTKALKRMNKHIIPVIQGICGVLASAGVIMMIGAAGASDFADEVGQSINTDAFGIAITGLITLATSAIIILLGNILKDVNENIIDDRRARYYKRKEELKEKALWDLGDYLYENKIKVDIDDELYDYSYGKKAMRRRLTR